jgi:hypothetical protein
MHDRSPTIFQPANPPYPVTVISKRSDVAQGIERRRLDPIRAGGGAWRWEQIASDRLHACGAAAVAEATIGENGLLAMGTRREIGMYVPQLLGTYDVT